MSACQKRLSAHVTGKPDPTAKDFGTTVLASSTRERERERESQYKLVSS